MMMFVRQLMWCLLANLLVVACASQCKSTSHQARHAESCPTVDSPFIVSEDNDKFFDFISGGLRRLFWSYNWQQYQADSHLNDCVKSVISVQRQLARGSTSAFAMLDASSSTASGFLTGSFSSLGDFDQCIKLKVDREISGQYCLLEFSLRNETRSLARDQRTIGGHLRSIIPILGYFLPRMSLCLPHQCSGGQVVEMTQHLLSSYPLQVTSTISCQSNYSISRRSLSRPQVASFVLISIMVTLTSLASLARYLVPDLRSPFVNAFSIQYHSNKLLYRSAGEASRHRGIDKLKVIFSLMFVSMHAIGGTDNPYSPLLLSNMLRALDDASRPEVQFLFSENLAEVMFMLTGYVTVTSIVSFVSKLRGNKSTVRVISYFMLSKWLRIVPLVFSLLALEFMWPLMATGPFYPEASNWLVNNCCKYWWTNVFLIANWFPSISKCCPQLFHSCVDFQLALVAISLLILLNESRAIGFLAAFVISSLSMIKLYMNALTHSVIPNYVSNGATIDQRMQFMDQIQLPTYSHLPAYVLGVLCAHKSVTRKQIYIPPTVNKMATYTCYLLSLAAAFAPALHNSFDLLTRELVPVYIVLQKLLFIAVLLPILLPSRQSTGSKASSGHRQEPASQQFDLLGCMSKLTFSAYLINFYVIRSDFMMARIPFEHGMHSANKRFVFSVLNTYLASFAFYLVFAGPFDEIRRIILDRLLFTAEKPKAIQR